MNARAVTDIRRPVDRVPVETFSITTPVIDIIMTHDQTTACLRSFPSLIVLLGIVKTNQDELALVLVDKVAA